MGAAGRRGGSARNLGLGLDDTHTPHGGNRAWPDPTPLPAAGFKRPSIRRLCASSCLVTSVEPSGKRRDTAGPRRARRRPFFIGMASFFLFCPLARFDAKTNSLSPPHNIRSSYMCCALPCASTDQIQPHITHASIRPAMCPHQPVELLTDDQPGAPASKET